MGENLEIATVSAFKPFKTHFIMGQNLEISTVRAVKLVLSCKTHFIMGENLEIATVSAFKLVKLILLWVKI